MVGKTIGIATYATENKLQLRRLKAAQTSDYTTVASNATENKLQLRRLKDNSVTTTVCKSNRYRK
ncbi:MAG: hypothetical protein BAJATHORv1_30521 [Candidatus Thorarchaeota archaeon]|nr:MAG: hypothetical protein BAJATHORv1_30521 [Candidatus Thorarchaeota archaeon]